MSDALSFSSELAAERSSERYYLEKRLQKFGLSYSPLEDKLKKLGLKGSPSNAIVDSLTSLKYDARSILGDLMESGYKYYNDDRLIDDANLSSALYLLDAERDTPSKYLNVFKKFKEKMGYKTVNVFDASEQINQVDVIFKISRSKGDVCNAIDALAESGYNLATLGSKAWICYSDKEAIREVAMSGPEEYLKIFKKLKEKLGYGTVRVASKGWLNENNRNQVQKVIEISKIPGNVCKAIDAFSKLRSIDVYRSGKNYSSPWDVVDLPRAFENYRIDKKKGITDKDVQIIKDISGLLWEKSLEEIRPCFYKENSEKFIECFKNLSIKEKKIALKGVFNCKKVTNEEVIAWLDENEPELVREVGLSLI